MKYWKERMYEQEEEELMADCCIISVDGIDITDKVCTKAPVNLSSYIVKERWNGKEWEIN